MSSSLISIRWKPKKQAFLVKGAKFTKTEEYPILKKEMVAKELPKKIMPFDKALNYHGDLSDVFVCTFAPDKTFKRIMKNPRNYFF